MARPLKLLTVGAARARMMAAVAPVESERVPLAQALGRVLRHPVVAVRDQPPFAASAMDGWAVIAGDGPGTRQIAGESAAGHPFLGELQPKEAVRIFTGAPLPLGADAVVIQEEATADGPRVTVPAASSGQHVRHAGHDFRGGETLLAPPVRLDPWRLALAAAAGCADLELARRPRVFILPTGEEIVGAGGRVGEAQIWDSGGPALAALVEIWGGRPIAGAPVGDSARAIAAAVASAEADLIVTLGGASVGDHDLVKPALAALGLEMAVESVAVRPGKPTWFGVLADRRPVLGLSGNPASALVCAELFLKPLIRALEGAKAPTELTPARLETALPANGPREHWLRARLSVDGEGGTRVAPFADQDSALVSVFARADALLRRPASAPAAAVGEVVEVLPLSRA